MPATPEPNPTPSDDLDELLDRGLRYALSLTHDRSDAEDLLQDAAASMLAKGAAWESYYLFATIRNRFIDRYRRTQRVKFVPLESHTSSANACDGREPADYLESDRLHRALGSLRDDERETLFLAVVEGFTAEEIARFTGRARGTVLSVIFRAKRKLRTLLEESREFAHLPRLCAS
jgi:RNA polymerase sigma-70 factor (ECF subfamily)